MIDKNIITLNKIRQQTLTAIKVRKTNGFDKITMIYELSKKDEIDFIAETYYASDQELEDRVKAIDKIIEEFVTEVDINQVL